MRTTFQDTLLHYYVQVKDGATAGQPLSKGLKIVSTVSTSRRATHLFLVLLVLLLEAFDLAFLLFQVDLALLVLLSQGGELRFGVFLQGPGRVSA